MKIIILILKLYSTILGGEIKYLAMKRIFVFIVLVFGSLSNVLKSQGLNAEFGYNENYYHHVNALLSKNEYTYLSLTGNRFPQGSTNFLLKLDTNGTTLWTIDVNFQATFNESPSIEEIIESPDGGVFILVRGMAQCDVGGGCYFIIQRISPLGEILWSQEWSHYLYSCNFSGLSFDEANGVRVNFYNDDESKVYSFNENGILTDSLSIERNELKFLVSTSSYETIGAVSDSVLSFDNEGNILEVLELNETINNQKNYGDTLFILAGNTLHIRSGNLDSIGSYTYEGIGTLIDIKYLNNKYILKSSSQEYNYIFVLNAGFEIQHIDSFTIEFAFEFNEQYQPYHSDYSNSHFTIAQDYNLLHTLLVPFQSIRFRDYSLTNSQATILNRTDAAAVGINKTGFSYSISSDESVPDNIAIWADVCVKNEGDQPLESIYINHEVLLGYVCWDEVYFQKFDSLNILPGDSLWINCGLIHSRWHYLPTNPGDTIRLSLCVFTSNPNGLVDLNLTNDNTCQLLDLGIVGIDKVQDFNTSRKLVKTVDILGRDHRIEPNTILFYIYDNGDVEKVIRLE